MNYFRAALAVLLPVFTAGILRTAPGDIDVHVAPDRTQTGKKFAPPTAKKPSYCAIISAGPMELGDAVAGEKIPGEEEVASLVKKALAKQHYLPIDTEHPDSALLIVYSWGIINPSMTDVDMGEGETATAQTNQRQMLGVVATNNMDLQRNSTDRKFFLPDLTDGRYFVLVAAYNHVAMKAGKSHAKALLWRTRLSTYSTGGGVASLTEALPRMLDSGAVAFGTDGYPLQLRNKLKKGTVTVGEAEVVEYVISGTDVRPTPPKPATPRN